MNADGNWGWQYKKFASHAKSISCESKNVIRHIATNWLERSLHRRSLKGVSNVWINIILFITHHLSFFSRECSGVITRAFNWIFHAYLTSDIFSLASPRWQARVYDKVEIERTDVRQLFRLQDEKSFFLAADDNNDMTFNYIICPAILPSFSFSDFVLQLQWWIASDRIAFTRWYPVNKIL